MNSGGRSRFRLRMVYYLIRESTGNEAILVYKSAGTPWWPGRTNSRCIEEISQAEYETYVVFGITEATSFEDVIDNII